MGICMILGALFYILYRTFNTRVKVLLILAFILSAFLLFKMDWRYALLGGSALIVLGGCIVAYMNLKDYVRIDATVVPKRDSPIDGRWDVDRVVAWLNKNNLGEYASRFEQESLNGKEVLKLTDSRLISLPLNVVNEEHRKKILEAIDKGLRLRRARRRYREGASPTEALVAAARAARTFAQHFVQQLVQKGTGGDMMKTPYKALDTHHDHDMEIDQSSAAATPATETPSPTSAEEKVAFQREEARLELLRFSASPPTRRSEPPVSAASASTEIGV